MIGELIKEAIVEDVRAFYINRTQTHRLGLTFGRVGQRPTLHNYDVIIERFLCTVRPAGDSHCTAMERVHSTARRYPADLSH
jgi:hypothetical protein